MALVAGATLGCLAAAASPAMAATQLGETFAPTEAVGNGATVLQSTSPGSHYAAPFAGVITSWSHRAGPATQQLKLKVGRPAGGGNFTIVGDSPYETVAPNALGSFPARIAVRPGDVIGLHAATGAAFATGASGYAFQVSNGDQPVGATPMFVTPPTALKFDISVSLERDCDNDNLGDETQDPAVTSACTDGDAKPPDTKILKPNTGRRAKFKFATTEPVGATFRCRLDKHKYKRCKTPAKYRVSNGAHTFRVYSIDAAGNADPTPALERWKVKPKP